MRGVFLISLSLFLVSTSLWLVHRLNHSFRQYISFPASVEGMKWVGNPYAKQYHYSDSLTGDSTYCFTYSFKGHRSNLHTWDWDIDRFLMDSLTDSYGLPLSFFKPFPATASVKRKRAAIRKKALFKIDDGYVVPDYNAVIAAHRVVTKPLYELLNVSLGDSASFESRIELMMKFCQDIPYKIPPAETKKKAIEGLLPPSWALTVGYGDCDTKAMLFVSTLSHDPNYEMILLSLPSHMLVAVKGIPKPYQHTYEYQGERYILCQPVGPARLNFGERGTLYRPVKKVTKVKSVANS